MTRFLAGIPQEWASIQAIRVSITLGAEELASLFGPLKRSLRYVDVGYACSSIEVMDALDGL